MSSFGERAAHGGLSMAGNNSPWGGQGPDGTSSAQEGDTPGGDAPGSTPDGEKPGGGKSGPRNPWLPPSSGGDTRRPSIEDIFRKRGGGGNGGGSGGGMGGGGRGGAPFRLPQRPDGKSWTSVVVGAVVLLWLGTSMVHRIAAQEEGVVTTFGSYSRTLKPGMAFTLPWPFQAVSTENVTQIRRESIPEGDAEKLMLTSDQNLVDLSYIVRWNIKDLKLYSFQLADPDQTVREVAEAAMRQSISEVSLGQVMGSGRAAIETSVRDRMQQILDAYRAGVTIQGVDIKKTDPPAKVVDAFKDVLAAQQDAQSAINSANGWARQLTARAQGEAAAFDKVYGQYKLAPEVTRRRMYYETMERVLSQTDKVIVEAPGTVPYLPLPAIRQTPPPSEGGAK